MGYGRRTCVGRIAGGRQDVRGGSVIWTVMAARQERRLPTTGKPVPTNSSDTSVTAGEIMSSPVGVIDVDESLWDAALRLSSGSRDRLVVLDRGRLVGVVDEKILTDHWPRLPFAVGERTLPRVVPRARARRQARPVRGWVGSGVLADGLAGHLAGPSQSSGAHAGSPAFTLHAWLCNYLCVDADSKQGRRRPDREQIDLTVEVFRMLADGTRVELLWALLDHELPVNELAATVGKPPAGVSQHLAKLRMARLVRTRRQGTQVFYRIENTHVRQLVQDALFHAEHAGHGVPAHHQADPAATTRPTGDLRTGTAGR